MRPDESGFGGIETAKLLDIYAELDRKIIETAHASAGGQADADLLRQISDVRREIDRRAADREGDPALLDRAARRLQADASVLPPLEPQDASILVADVVASLSERDLRAALSKHQSALELHRRTYGESIEIRDAIERATVERWRSRTTDILRALAGEMLRRGIVPSEVSNQRQVRRSGGLPSLTTATRQAVVRGAVGESDIDVCRRLDSHAIPLPEKWQEEQEAIRTWLVAYESPEYRRRVQVILSKERRRST